MAKYDVYKYSGYVHDRFGWMATNQYYVGEVDIDTETRGDEFKREIKKIFDIRHDVPLDDVAIYGDDLVVVVDCFVDGEVLHVGYLKLVEYYRGDR